MPHDSAKLTEVIQSAIRRCTEPASAHTPESAALFQDFGDTLKELVSTPSYMDLEAYMLESCSIAGLSFSGTVRTFVAFGMLIERKLNETRPL